MKNWDVTQWIKFMLAIMIVVCLTTYFIGIFVLKQPTTEVNLQLRTRIIDLFGFIAAQLLVDKKNNDNNKNT